MTAFPDVQKNGSGMCYTASVTMLALKEFVQAELDRFVGQDRIRTKISPWVFTSLDEFMCIIEATSAARIVGEQCEAHTGVFIELTLVALCSLIIEGCYHTKTSI
jgi:hypothetical protein